MSRRSLLRRQVEPDQCRSEPEEPDEPEDEDWYDTTVLETIEGIGADDEAEEPVVAVGEVADDEIGTEVVG